MSPRAKGLNKIDTILYDWSEEDRQDAIEFASHPGNGTSSIALYLHQKGVRVSINTVHRWQRSLIAESERITRIKQTIGDFKGLEPTEIIGFVAALMAETLSIFQQKIELSEDVSLKDIQGLTSLAKEARSAASSLMTSQSTTTMKDLELGFAMNFADKLEAIFEDDEATLDRIRIACRGILTEIEGQYQN